MNDERSGVLSVSLKAILTTALAAVLITGCIHIGMRVLQMQIYQGDQLVLHTTFDAPDNEGPADLWRRAGDEPWASEASVAQVKADQDNPLRATLTGPVQINIIHVDRLMTSASLTNLVLRRNCPHSLMWYLAPEEVERAKRAAGL